MGAICVNTRINRNILYAYFKEHTIVLDDIKNLTELSKISQDIQYVKFISSEQRDLDEVVVNV
jgi:hypothetical protein